MSFDLDWLDLRAPADAAARDPDLLAAAIRHVAGMAAPVVLDLGCGAGATCGAFAEAPSDLRWRLVDRDRRLLAIAAARCGGQAETVVADLADLDRLPFEGVRLVTASALLDLAGGAWIEALAGRLAAARTGIYAALSYDGGLEWDPPLPQDDAVRAAFNAHQRRDKGLEGAALGPGAAAALAEALARRGLEVRLAPSPWRLGPAQAVLQRALVEGIARAAGEAGLAGAAAWGQARRAASGSGRCVVGHADVLALPQGASAQSNTTSDSRP